MVIYKTLKSCLKRSRKREIKWAEKLTGRVFKNVVEDYIIFENTGLGEEFDGIPSDK